MRRARIPQGDLFGRAPPAVRDTTPVTVALEAIGPSCTPKAWFLRQPFRGGKSGFAPRSECRAVEGRRDRWIMPRWLAKERGWL